MKHITMSFAYVPRPFQKTLWRPCGMLSMSFRHVLVRVLAMYAFAQPPLIEESYQFSEIRFQLLA